MDSWSLGSQWGRGHWETFEGARQLLGWDKQVEEWYWRVTPEVAVKIIISPKGKTKDEIRKMAGQPHWQLPFLWSTGIWISNKQSDRWRNNDDWFLPNPCVFRWNLPEMCHLTEVSWSSLSSLRGSLAECDLLVAMWRCFGQMFTPGTKGKTTPFPNT